MHFINGKVWLFLMLVVLAVSSFYLWQSGHKVKKAYAGGRMVERMSPEKIRSNFAA